VTIVGVALAPVVAVVAVGACGPGLSEVRRDANAEDAARLDELASGLLAATDARDVARVRALLHDSVMLGGLWFEDAACAAEFTLPGEVRAARLDELARCLTTLALVRSGRRDALPDVAVLTHAPGIELGALLAHEHGRPRLRWLGFAGRRHLVDVVPTITPAALEARRLAGHPQAAPMTELGAERSYAWLHVCLDTDGQVGEVEIRETSSPRAARAFARAVRAWRFQPFTVADQPVPVCAMVRLEHPAPGGPVEEKLPLPLPADLDDLVIVPSHQLERVHGDPRIVPDDRTRMQIYQLGLGRLIAALSYCIGVDGRVFRVRMIRRTRFPAYDARLMAGIERWVFRPFHDGGKPIRVCSSTAFHYRQTGTPSRRPERPEPRR
jgi:hypothetical protein